MVGLSYSLLYLQRLTLCLAYSEVLSKYLWNELLDE